MADTIEIIQGTATTVEVAGPTGPQGPAGVAGATGAQGPQGVPGTGLEVLTTQGDLLYQGVSTGQRLAIGTSNQVLKVVGGIPAWGNESGAVTSVNGETGAVTVAAALHAAEHEAGEADEIQAMAALVETEDVSLNGIYVPNASGTMSGGRLVYYKPGTRQNTKLEYNVSLSFWYLIKNTVVQLAGQEEGAAYPWTPQQWLDERSPQVLSNGGTITRAPLEILARRAADGTSNVAPATTSADGLLSSSDKTKLDGIASGAEVNVNADWNASSGDAQILNKPTSLTPTAHASTHHTGGTDALAPSDIGAQSIFVTEDLGTVTANVTLTAARAKIYTVNTTTSGLRILLPTTDVLAGDVVTIRFTSVTGQSLTPVRGSTSGFFTNDILTGQQVTFIAASTSSTSWTETLVDRHPATSSLVFSSDDTFPVRISGRTQEASVTSAGRDLLDDADAAAQRVTMGAAASGSITSSGLTQATARILGRTTASAGAVEEIQIGAGLSLSAGELSATGSGVTAVGPSTADVLSVSGSDLVADDPNADRIIFWDDSESKLRYLEAGSGLSISGTTLTATASGGISAVDATTADVLSVSGSNLVADDGGTIDSADPFIKWNDTAGKLVYANPLSRPSGAFYVGLAPTTTALGSNATNVAPSRSNANQVASGDNSVCVGANARAAGGQAISVGLDSAATGSNAVAIGRGASASGNETCCFGRGATASGTAGTALGFNSLVAAQNASAVGNAVIADLRAQFSTIPFNAVYWGGQTTNATATILNLDATATNRFTIAASTALAVDILLVARRSDTADKWLVARRFLGIRRDGSNNTSLIGSVQTLGVDQSDGSPSWTFALTADSVNHALQLEVTGAASETIQWRATAFYRVA